jgi:hypothetical protein
MQMKRIIWFVVCCLLALQSNAQLRNVLIEKYYVSDVNDASDTIGGHLSPNTITYRIYAHLEDNARVTSIFGDDRHPFYIHSSESFFNNLSQGKSFGKDFTKAMLSENTVVLDSYLTIGQAAKQGSKVYFGIPKHLDSDGSFVGGVNNDGGSAAGAGLISGQSVDAGIPVTQADGFDTLVVPAINWSNSGVQDFVTGNDSTIFGSLVVGNTFESSTFNLTSSTPISGVLSDSNYVLLAQLTTLGDLAFDINLEVESWENGQWVAHKFVSADTLLDAGELYNPYLSYPYNCGCMDPAFLEYNSAFVCSLDGSCQNLIVSGCADSMACNYDPAVNVNIPELCCYPGNCNNRDLIEVCPQLMGEAFELNLFPNPAVELINCNVLNSDEEDIEIFIYNANGSLQYYSKVNQAPHNYSVEIALSDYNVGLYQVLIRAGSKINSGMFFKM